MSWAKTTLVLGLLLLALGFAAGVEPGSTSVDGQRHGCDAVISTSWLVPGTANGPEEPAATTRERAIQRQVEQQCGSLTRSNQWLTWGGLGLGSMMLLLGWTALRGQDEAEPDVRVLSRR